MRLQVRSHRFASLALLAASVWGNGNVPAEEPSINGARAGLDPIQIRLKRFDIPFSIDAVGQRPAEVQLFVSRDAGGHWNKYSTQPPTAQKFLVDIAEDGDYWFATRTIDGAGNSYPQGAIKPGLFVRIDTTDPDVTLHAEITPDSSVLIDLKCLDQWPRRESLVVEQMTDVNTMWSEVPGFAAMVQATAVDRLEATMQFKPAGDWHQLSVRAIVKDLAGNQTIVTHQLQRPRLAAAPSQLASSPLPRTDSDSPVLASVAQINPYAIKALQVNHAPPARIPLPSAYTSPPPAGPSPAPIAVTPFFPTNTPLAGANAPPGMIGIATQQLPPSAHDVMGSGLELDEPTLTAPNQATAPVKRPTTPAQAMRPMSPADLVRPEPAAPQAVARPALSTTESLPPTIPAAAMPPLNAAMTSAPIRHSRSRKFSLDYEVESAGRAGVEEVELWGSADRGQTWKRWGGDPDRQTPFDIETNNDGVYGFCIVVVAKNGLATPRPIEQTTPDIFVAVDTLPPVVRISGATYGEADQTGSLLIRFECQDENLATRPISLSFSDTIHGPWTTLAAGLENRGGYVWPADPQLPRQIFLRIDATDLAGNTGSYVLEAPIDIQGLAPRARIRGFNPITGTIPATAPAPQTATTPSAKFK